MFRVNKKLFGSLNRVAGEKLASLSGSKEKVLDSTVSSHKYSESQVINLATNNFIGTHFNKEVIRAAKEGLETRGFGLGSVRFICGTQDKHKELEREMARYYDKEDAITYTSGFSACQGFYEAILTPEDAVFFDSDVNIPVKEGIKYCKADKHQFPNRQYDILEDKLSSTEGRMRLIVTSALFPNSGRFADIERIANLAVKYKCQILLDETHGTGITGPTGRGIAERAGLLSHIDIITTTAGKALGGASGGITIGSSEVIGVLRQKSRPYLFSNNMVPSSVCGALEAVKIMNKPNMLSRLKMHTLKFKQLMEDSNIPFESDEDSPIIILRAGSAERTVKISEELLKRGVFLPAVTEDNEYFLRIMISAEMTETELKQGFAHLREVLKEFNI